MGSGKSKRFIIAFFAAFALVAASACNGDDGPDNGNGNSNGQNGGEDCLDVAIEQCESISGCHVFTAFPYDAERDCYHPEQTPVFCQAFIEYVCDPGMPVILTDPEGNLWYVRHECFTRPVDWSVEYLLDEVPICPGT